MAGIRERDKRAAEFRDSACGNLVPCLFSVRNMFFSVSEVANSCCRNIANDMEPGPTDCRLVWGAKMKIRITVAALAVALFAVPAGAEPRNDTPRAQACMKKYGFTYAEWRAYTVPAAKAVPYRKCRDSTG